MTERLGSIYFSRGKHRQVKETLLWLLNKGERARRTESYYQLGRSLWELQLYQQAAKSMGLYLAAPKGIDQGTLPDAYFVAGSSRESAGDRKGALKLFEAALKLPNNPRNDEFVYRTAQINLHEGKTGRAKELFDQLVKNGKDPDWQKLARQALTSFEAGASTP
jgi:tetratricopeptide (TPR) repeat protein